MYGIVVFKGTFWTGGISVKKLLASMVLLVLLMLPVSAVGASALEAKPGETCPWCGKGTMVYCKTEYTPWAYVDRQLCVHGDPLWVDKIEERTVIEVYHCSNEACNIYNDGVVRNESERLHCIEYKTERQNVHNHK